MHYVNWQSLNVLIRIVPLLWSRWLFVASSCCVSVAVVFFQKCSLLKFDWSHSHLTPPSFSGSFNGLDNGWQLITHFVLDEQTTIISNSWAPLAVDERTVGLQWISIIQLTATWYSAVTAQNNSVSQNNSKKCNIGYHCIAIKTMNQRKATCRK